jgi:hypothetical protein
MKLSAKSGKFSVNFRQKAAIRRIFRPDGSIAD